MEAAVDEVVFGRYRLIALIGEGGMGKVYKAYDTVIGRDVAIKVLPTELSAEAGYQERFRREAHVAARLTEPHIIPIYDTGEVDGRLYLVMPVINGIDLQGLLHRDGPMSPQRAVHVIGQLAAALQAAHAVGLVHRDIKPSNALVTGDDFVYLIDFGIAHDAAATKLTSTGMMVGTWAYMAPERFTSGTADVRADVYALACVLFECLTGAQPFRGDSMEQQIAGHLTLAPPRPSDLNPAVPAEFDEVIAAGMAKNPDERYQSARELAAAANQALSATAFQNPHSIPTLLAESPGAAGRLGRGDDQVRPPAAASDAVQPEPADSTLAADAQSGQPVKTRQVIQRDRLGALTKIGQGGQGVVYRAPNVKTKFAASMVYKEYKPQARTGIDFSALAAMPALVEESLSYSQAERLISIAAWPCALVQDAGDTTGFVMPAIPAEFFIPLTTVKGASSATAEFQHLLNHPTVLTARGIEINEVQRYSLLREVASGLAFLHKHGVCVGDISPKNLLFSLAPHEDVYFIDCDAMRINGVSALPQVETPGWQVPAGEELATIYSDAYKLGLLALRLMAGDHETKSPQHLPSTTPGLLRQIITDTLNHQPQSRPLPEAWTYVLGNAVEQAQYRKNTAASTPTSVAAPPPPPTPIVHSRPTSRPSAPPPPPPTVYSRPPVAASAPPSRQASSAGIIWAVVALVAVVVVALVVVGVVLAHQNNNNPVPSSASATSPTEPSSYSAYPTSTSTDTPALDPEAAALQQLQQLAAGDRDFVSAQLADHWIPQLSSKHSTEPWTYDSEDGTEYHNEQILQEHQRLRQQYNAKLLWSGDWTTYDHPDYWVTVVPQTFSDSDSVLSWCNGQQKDSDHCSAEMVSTTLGPNGTHQP